MTPTQKQYQWFFIMLIAAASAFFLFFKTEDWPTVPCVIGGVICAAGAIYSGIQLGKISK